jgi:uncharacterized protein (UPF0548 family)
VILLHKPSDEAIRRFLDEQRSLAFSYSEVGGTTNPPSGYVVDHHRIELGSGEKTFLAAGDALRRWRQFQLGWLAAWPSHTPIQVNAAVVVIARVLGMWCLNACRIVYVVDEHGPVRRFGFAYGTLPGHVESGEERFLVEWDEATGSVSYDILAFSRPNHVLTKLGYPYVRRLQKRFARDSMAAMQRSVRSSADCDR